MRTGTKIRRMTIEKKLLQLLASEGGATTRPTSQLARELGLAARSLEITIQRMYAEGTLVRRDESRTLRLGDVNLDGMKW